MIDTKWSKYFKAPFHNDRYDPGTIWDSAGNRVTTPTMDTIDSSTDAADRCMEIIVKALNARCEGKEPTEKAKFVNPEYTGTNTDSTIRFTVDGTEVVLNVRGWGFLTGYKKLPNNTAAEIQDEFGKFVIECIKAATEPSDKE